jgi:hypothetical protein
VIVIEGEGPYVVFLFWRKRFGMQTMRVPVGRVPQNKTHMGGTQNTFFGTRAPKLPFYGFI